MEKKVRKPKITSYKKGDRITLKIDPRIYFPDYGQPEEPAPIIKEQPALTIPQKPKQSAPVVQNIYETPYTLNKPVYEPYKSALPSLEDMMAPPSFEEYMKDQFRQILAIPRLKAPHEFIDGGFLPHYANGKESVMPDDDPEKTYNTPELSEVVIQPAKRSDYSIPNRAMAQPSDTTIQFTDQLTKDQILDDIYTSNPGNLQKYEQEVYKRKKGINWDQDRGAYYKWLGSKPFLRSKTRREILEGKYRTHIDKLYGQYAQDVSDAINYVNGYFNSPEYADRMRGYDIYNPVDGVAEGRKFLSQYARDGINASWEYSYKDGDNTFHIPKELPMWETVYNSQYDPYFAAAHEYAHYMQAKTRGYGNNAFADREKALFDRRNNVVNNHDSRYDENYADLIATRADMYRRGLVKNPYDAVSPEAIKEYRQKYGANNRFFNMYEDDDIRAMYNTIAYNPYIKIPNMV